jgi:hypothetical protein
LPLRVLLHVNEVRHINLLNGDPSAPSPTDRLLCQVSCSVFLPSWLHAAEKHTLHGWEHALQPLDEMPKTREQ